MTVVESLRLFRENCTILYQGEMISVHPLLEKYANFLVDFFSRDERAVSFSAHTGSELFDVMALVYGFIRSLCGTGDADIRDRLVIAGYEEVKNPSVGDVLFEYNMQYNRVYPVRIDEINESEQPDEANPLWEPEYYYKAQCKIGSRREVTCYYRRDKHFFKSPNPSTFETARPIPTTKIGAQRDRCKDFFHDVLGYDAPPSRFKSRFVACLAKELCNGVSIRYKEENFTLSELQPDASPVLFCEHNFRDIPNLIGRERLVGLDWNGILLGSSCGAKLSSGEVTTFVRERISLKSLMFNAVGPVECMATLANMNDVRGFVCTRDLMQNFVNNEVIGGGHSSPQLQKLNAQIKIIAERHIHCVVLEDIADVSLINDVRSDLRGMALDNPEDDSIRSFLCGAYSLLKLLQTSILPLAEIQDIIQRKRTGLTAALNRTTGSRSTGQRVLAHIDRICTACSNSRIVYEAINGLECRNPQTRTVIAIPDILLEKAEAINQYFYGGYTPRQRERLVFKPRGRLQRFSRTSDCDALVVVGGVGYYDLQAFDYLSSLIAKDVYVLLYRSDIASLLNACNVRRDQLTLIGGRAVGGEGLVTTDLDSICNSDSLSVEARNGQQALDESHIVSMPSESEINDKEILDRIYKPSTRCGRNAESDQMRPCCAYLVFEGEGEAFLTNGYRATRILETQSGEIEIKERADADSIEVGDMLVFPVNADRRLDALDEMIEHWVEHEVNAGECERYRNVLKKASSWKTSLWNYRDKGCMNDRQVARNLMQQQGCPVQEAAIMNWLDPDSHVVCPDNHEAALYAIGTLVGNQEMIENPKQYYDACQVVYELRGKMRARLKRMICNRLSATAGGADVPVSTNLDEIVRVVRVSYIDRTERSMPYTRVNRLLEF